MTLLLGALSPAFIFHATIGTMQADPVLQSFLKGIQPYRGEIRTIYLFGSRARGDFLPDSDYDLLVVAKEKDFTLKDKIYDVLTDVSLEFNRDLSMKFFSQAEFERLRTIPSRFVQTVLKEGIKLG